MRSFALLSLLLSAGCVRVDINHSAVLPANGIQRLEARIERGSLTWSGNALDAQIDLDVWSWAAGAGEKRARAIERSNDWGVRIDEGTGALWGDSPSPKAGVDFAALGPGRLDFDAVSLDGQVAVQSITGDVLITADSVVADGVTGSADLYAWTGGIDAVLHPAPGDLITLHAVGGDIFLGLPEALDYDIEISAPPSLVVDIEDLLFDEYAIGPGWFTAHRGERSIVVRVVAEAGNVVLYEVDG